MPSLLDGLSRIELFQLRQNHSFRVSIANQRLIHWKALTHAASSLSADFATEDKTLSRFMLDVCVKAAARQKECVAEITSLENQMACIHDILRGQDHLMTLKKLAEEQAEIEGNTNAI